MRKKFVSFLLDEQFALDPPWKSCPYNVRDQIFRHLSIFHTDIFELSSWMYCREHHRHDHLDELEQLLFVLLHLNVVGCALVRCRFALGSVVGPVGPDWRVATG